VAANPDETRLALAIPPEVINAIAARVTDLIAERFEPPEPSPYMTIFEAADYLRCGRQRVDDLLSRGRLTRVKDGTRTLVRRDEIHRYLGAE
jgi:excisionase family DNA binding protein